MPLECVIGIFGSSALVVLKLDRRNFISVAQFPFVFHSLFYNEDRVCVSIYSLTECDFIKCIEQDKRSLFEVLWPLIGRL